MSDCLRCAYLGGEFIYVIRTRKNGHGQIASSTLKQQIRRQLWALFKTANLKFSCVILGVVNEENDQENSLDDTIPQNYLKCCIPLASQFRSDLRSLSNNNSNINNNKSLVRK